MKISVIGTSKKENEKRVAIHPKHLDLIPKNIRKQLYFEENYGEPFDFSDKQMQSLTGNQPQERSELLKTSDAVIIPKPVEEDFEQMREGITVWGWIHSVQQERVTQIAIDKKMSLLAWENMHRRMRQNKVHIFYKNNEMAGYCAVQHAMELRGIDGNYGPERKAVILSFGSVSRGALYALLGHGIHDITVYTRRAPSLVANQYPGVKFRQMFTDRKNNLQVRNVDGTTSSLIDVLADTDIIVNGILQNPEKPVMFVTKQSAKHFNKECLIIDVSCDKGMGFYFAEPTTFAEPIINLDNIHYYAVDHTPTLLWNSASWEISSALLPYLNDFALEKENSVLKNAYDMIDGMIQKNEILSFQNRSSVYPYERVDTV